MRLIHRVWYRVLKTWWQATVPMRLRATGVEIGAQCRFYGMPIVGMEQNSRIVLGDRVVLCSDSRFTALGVNHPVVLRTLRPGAKISIGSDSGMSGGAICAAVQVELGIQCLIGANVTIADTDFHTIKPTGRTTNNDATDIGSAPIRIDDNVFIGTGSIILKGVHIGTNSVIGAMSVVSRNVKQNSISAGIPATLLREEIQNIL